MGDSGGPTASSRAGAAVPIRAAKVSRTALIQDLRQRIDALERTGRHVASLPRSSSLSASCSVSLPLSGVGDADVPPDPRMPPRPPSASPTLTASSVAVPPALGDRWVSQDAPWTFGDAQIDAVLPGGALDSAALHEIKPRSYNDWSAAFVFAVRLAVRRLGPPVAQGARPTTLWCHTRARGNDLGRLYAPGLEALGLSAETVIIVETARAAEVLWAMEEGLGSRAVALVIGAVDQIGLTPSRRLSLAAAAAGTPCLLLSADDNVPWGRG